LIAGGIVTAVFIAEITMTERVQAWRSAALAGLLFGVLYSAIMGLAQGRLPSDSLSDIRGLVLEVLGNGLLFGLLIGSFLRSPIIPQIAEIPLRNDEVLLHSGLANHFLNMESRGGRLALTTSHLRFIPHAINLQRSSLEIPRDEILDIAPVRIFKVFSNGLAIRRRSGETEYFVVSDRRTWLDKLDAGKSPA
jgi:hypothetical protein